MKQREELNDVTSVKNIGDAKIYNYTEPLSMHVLAFSRTASGSCNEGVTAVQSSSADAQRLFWQRFLAHIN